MSWLRWRSGLLLLPLLAGLWWLARPPAVEVEAAMVRRGELIVGFREEARTRAREPFLLTAPVPGSIDRITFEPGDALAAGQVLVRLRPTAAVLLDPRTRAETQARERAARAAVRAAARRVEALEADLAQARRDDERMTQMVSSAVSAAERDRSASRVQTLSATLQAAHAETERARNEAAALSAALSSDGASGAAGDGVIELTAPIAGVLLKRHLQSAQPVAAGQPLLELAAADDLEVEVEVLSEDAVRLRPGGEVRLRRWGGDAELEARVRRIDPGGYTKVSALGVEEQRTRVWASLISPPEQRLHLGVGYRVEAYFVLARHPDVLLVPGSAVARTRSDAGVYRMVGGRAQRVAVELIAENDEEAAVRGDLADGQPIVAHPDDRVVDGMSVRAVE